ncbi:MAG: hypothetical protein KDK64_01395 [Chlamydiia bacterium]|nr:hypothetical protein [Chlamydiia bacterium]
MKKSSLLALAAFTLFGYPMFAGEEEESTEEPVAIEETAIEVSLNDEETKENFIALNDDEEEADARLALNDDEEEADARLALNDDEEEADAFLALNDDEEEADTFSA